MEANKKAPSTRKLVIFDVEGVILPKNRFVFEAGRRMGFRRLIRILAAGLMYQAGLLNLKKTLQTIYGTLRGLTVTQAEAIADAICPMPGAHEALAQLKQQGCVIAFVSSGLPTFIVKRLAQRFNVDYAFGIDVDLDSEVFTGNIQGDVIESEGKKRVLMRILKKEGLQPNQCAVVADDRNNLPLFLPETRKIGFNPDFLVKAKADVAISDELDTVPNAVNASTTPRRRLTANKLARETVHAAGALVPAITMLIGTPLMVYLTLTVSGLYAASELLRLSGNGLPVIRSITRCSALPTEHCDFVAAPLYFAAGILLTLVLYRPPANYAAIAAFAFGDSAASIIGGQITNKPLPFNKSKTPEGTAAEFAFAFVGAAFFVPPQLALAAAATATAIELLPLPVNDNITMPLAAGLTLTMLL